MGERYLITIGVGKPDRDAGADEILLFPGPGRQSH
jgi:hypothetical protein